MMFLTTVDVVGTAALQLYIRTLTWKKVISRMVVPVVVSLVMQIWARNQLVPLSRELKSLAQNVPFGAVRERILDTAKFVDAQYKKITIGNLVRVGVGALFSVLPAWARYIRTGFFALKAGILGYQLACVYSTMSVVFDLFQFVLGQFGYRMNIEMGWNNWKEALKFGGRAIIGGFGATDMGVHPARNVSSFNDIISNIRSGHFLRAISSYKYFVEELKSDFGGVIKIVPSVSLEPI